MIFDRYRRMVILNALVISEKLSVVGIVGLGLILLAISYMAIVTLPEWKHERALKSQLAILNHRLAQAPDLAPEVPANTADQSPLPAESELPGVLAAIAHNAADNQLGFPAAEYTWTPSTASSFGQYELLFEVKGGYLAIRHFIEDVENDQPAVALRELSLTRDTAGQTDVRARMRLVIFTQGNSK